LDKIASLKEYFRDDYLPPCSPNLNSIERLWKIMHEMVSYNKYYETFSDFTEATLNFFRNIGKHKSLLRSRITDNFQILHSPLSILQSKNEPEVGRNRYISNEAVKLAKMIIKLNKNLIVGYK
jgi:hypothetical protein